VGNALFGDADMNAFFWVRFLGRSEVGHPELLAAQEPGTAFLTQY
jgi:hypothetical protein